MTAPGHVQYAEVGDILIHAGALYYRWHAPAGDEAPEGARVATHEEIEAIGVLVDGSPVVVVE